MENYESVAKSRLKDWEVLSNEKKKVGAIHFGGIVIECMLKGIICSEYPGIVEDGHNWIDGAISTSRPSHDIDSTRYRTWLEDIYDDMTLDVSANLTYVAKPEGKSYIDYRYVPEEDVSDTVFEKWEEAFLSVYCYIIEKQNDL